MAQHSLPVPGVKGPTYSRVVKLLLTRRDLARAFAPLLLIWFSAKLPKERERSG